MYWEIADDEERKEEEMKSGGGTYSRFREVKLTKVSAWMHSILLAFIRRSWREVSPSNSRDCRLVILFPYRTLEIRG